MTMYPFVPCKTALLSPFPLVVQDKTAMRSSLYCRTVLSCLSTRAGVNTQLDWIRFTWSPSIMEAKCSRK